MAETVLKLGEGTPEEVAFKLFQTIAMSEGKKVYGTGGLKPADKEWVLKTYAECLMTVKNPSAKLAQ